MVHKLFDQYDDHVENGNECDLKWNKKHTVLQNRHPLPTKTIDPVWSPSRQTKIKIFYYKGAQCKQTNSHIKYTCFTGILNLCTKWLRKNPGVNCTWISV